MKRKTMLQECFLALSSSAACESISRPALSRHSHGRAATEPWEAARAVKADVTSRDRRSASMSRCPSGRFSEGTRSRHLVLATTLFGEWSAWTGPRWSHSDGLLSGFLALRFVVLFRETRNRLIEKIPEPSRRDSNHGALYVVPHVQRFLLLNTCAPGGLVLESRRTAVLRRA